MIAIFFLNNRYFEQVFHNIATLCYYFHNRFMQFA